MPNILTQDHSIRKSLYAALHRILSCAPGPDVGYAASYLRFLVACGTRIAISRDSLLVTLLWKTPTAVV